MVKRYNARPSEIAGVRDEYAAYCLDEACMYILCKIEEDGCLPKKLESNMMPRSNHDFIRSLRNVKEVKTIDQRGNDSGLSHPFDNRL